MEAFWGHARFVGTSSVDSQTPHVYHDCVTNSCGLLGQAGSSLPFCTSLNSLKLGSGIQFLMNIKEA